jgi:TfoX/Sxy family transcriptional regulator of competence genes
MAKIARGAKTPQHSPDVDPRVARVAEAFAKDPQVTFGKMFSSMGLKVGGKIFAMFVKGAFVAKLAKERVEELVRRRTGVHFDPGHGRLMKEWVAVEGTEELWGDLARKAKRFVGGHKS